MNLLKLYKATSIVLLLLLGACNNKSTEAVERPREAWVVRSVLDQRPRMISIALHDNLWVAYSTETASFYKAWTGGMNFDGAVYTAAHGPQPTSLGNNYLVEPNVNPWKIIAGGKEIEPKVMYKGHVITDNKVIIKYDLAYEGNTISIKEQPEYFSADGEKVGLQRVFNVTGVPAGTEVALNLNFTSIISENDVQTNGLLNIQNKAEEVIGGRKYLVLQGILKFKPEEKTELNVKFTPKPAEELVKQAELEGEEAVFALMARSDCNTCHNKEVKTVGPSYVDIAKKYENTAQRKNFLVNKIIDGGAGNWGEIPMTPHPDLDKNDAAVMVSYILELDGEKEGIIAANELMPTPAYEIEFVSLDPGQVNFKEEMPGIAVNIYQFSESVTGMPETTDKMIPVASGVSNAIHADENDFGDFENNFSILATGILNIEKTINVVFRLVSDDGSKLFINNELVINHDGFHGLDPMDGEIILKEGKHPFRVEYFQGGGGKGLSLQWRPYGAERFEVVPPPIFTFRGSDVKKTQESPLALQRKNFAPGDTYPLETVHPSFDLAQARPDDFQPKVGGMDFLSDGRMVVSTWDSLGSVYILDGVQGKDPKNIKVKRIAFGLAEPLGLKVVDDEIYVLQKQELTKLIDHNNDDIIDEYLTLCNGWNVSANFHEFAFGLVHKDGFFYATLATAINPGGASTKPQIPDRGKVLKISRTDGSFEFIASGLRTPNGINFGVDNEIFIADNQGDWLPASKILHLEEGAFYGSRSVDFEGTANFKEKPPVIWLPQDEIGNSPSQPAILNVGPYQNQMIHGEVTHGGIKRVFIEKINGQYQGAVFRFTQGLEAGINRLTWGPDGALYAGGVGSTGNWSHIGKFQYGLQRLTFNNKITFEMLAVRAKSNGVEIEFTEPLKAGVGTKASDYNIRQWWYKPTEEYGGPKLDNKELKISAVTLSEDRKRVFLKLSGMKANHVVYIRLNRENLISESDQNLWSTEAWYTMNSIPTDSGLARK
ncbi:hypothetical protein BH23BAC1_BH23BAC1_23240 [soil metagenome]